MNLKPVSKTRDSSTKMGLGDAAAAGDDEGESSGKGVSQKRKQDSFLVEVQERAEVLFIEHNESDFLHFKVALYSHSASLCCRLF